MTPDFHFRRLSVEACPPLGSGEFEFDRGLNLIVGDNGSGKTSILQALVDGAWPHGGRATVQAEGDRASFAGYEALVLVVNGSDPAGGDRPRACWTHLAAGNPQVRAIMERLFLKAIASKLGKRMTKFANIPDCGPGTFAIEVDAEGRVAVDAGPALGRVALESPYGSVKQLFIAAGEQALLHMCGILAAREWLGIRAPLLLDAPFSHLDEFLRESLWLLLHPLQHQVIVTAGFHEDIFRSGHLSGARRIELRHLMH